MKRRQPSRRGSEGGYILLGILLMVTFMVIALASVLPAIRTQIKRDREEELIRRGRQYQRAIQLYYRRLGSYPASIEQLENTNNIRFLRKRYVDPMTGKDEWKLIRFGQQRPKTRPAYLGGGATPAGATPASGIGGPGAQQQPNKPQAGITNAADISRPLSGSKTLGGGPIVGVASTSEKDAIKELDGKTKYNEWEFVYDPTLDPNARQIPNQGAGPGGLGGPGGPRGPGQPGTPSPNSPMGPGPMQPQPQQPQPQQPQPQPPPGPR